ncbi:MAG TPA: lipid II flippase MurJ, partial [Candidatus Paceibacterota bacterium]
ALLPVLSRFEAQDQRRVRSLLEHMLVYFFVAMIAISGVAFVFAPKLLQLLVPGIAASSSFGALLLLTRVLLLQPILLGASNIVANLTQLRHRFLLYSISPLLYNLGIIAGIIWLYPVIGLRGVVWGVVLGACLHLLVQLPFFFSEKGGGNVSWRESWRALVEVLRLSIPRTLSLAANQISLAVLVALASFLSAGSIAVFTLAWNLQAVPLTIIGVSYSVAAFPTLSRLFAGGENSAFVRHLETAVRHIVFWSVPATVFIIVLRAQLVRTILGAGAFDWTATRLTAAALALCVVSLLAQSLSLLIARAYYAAGDSKKPFMFGLVDVIVSVTSALVLVNTFHTSQFWRYFLESLLRVADIPGTTVLMLALAMALGSIAEFAVGWVYIKRDFALKPQLIKLFFETFSASVIGAAVAYWVLAVVGTHLDIDTALGVMLQGGLAGALGLIVTGGMLWLLNNQELREALGSLHQRLQPQTSPVVLEPTDVQSN